MNHFAYDFAWRILSGARAPHNWLAHAPEADVQWPPHPPFGHLLPAGRRGGFFHLAPWGEVGRRPGEGVRVCACRLVGARFSAVVGAAAPQAGLTGSRAWFGAGARAKPERLQGGVVQDLLAAL